MAHGNLSVVIITKNRLDKLCRCLDSVMAFLPDSEIIVVDNGSTDGTVQYLESIGKIKPLFLENNRGVAGARNIGVNKAQRELVMFLDDDAWIHSFNVNEIERFFEDNKKVGLLAPKILYPDGSLQESVRIFPSIGFVTKRGLISFGLWKADEKYSNSFVHEENKIHKIDWAIGACQIIRRKVFSEVGLLDEKYFFGYEDADFCRSLDRAGYERFYWPLGTIFHEYNRSSTKSLLPLLRHLKSLIRYFFKG